MGIVEGTTSPILAAIIFFLGLGLVTYFAKKLVEGAAGTSCGFRISAFLLSVLFIGFDPENLVVGAVGFMQGVPRIALGSIIGAAMLALAFAIGITALIVPLGFSQVPKQIIVCFASIVVISAVC